MAQTGSSGVFKVGQVLMQGGVRILSGSGAPTSGTGGAFYKAGPGSLYVRTSNGAVYANTNTLASPTWSQLGTVTALAEGSVFVGDSGGAASEVDASGDGKILVGDGTTLNSVTVSGDVTLTNAGAVAIGAGKVTNAMVAPAALDGTVAKVVADVNVIGGFEVLHRIDIAAGALANTDVVLTHKTRVIDAWVIMRGAGVSTTTLTVKNGTSAITDALDVSGADKTIVRAAEIDDAAYEIAAAGTLRITTAVGASQPACTVYVRGIRVA